MKIGIDIGGSHIGIGLVDKELIIVKKECNITIEPKKNIESFIEKTIDKYIEEILQEQNLKICDIDLIGIAVPGIIKDGVIIKATNLGIKNFNIKSILSNKYDTKILVRNDGKCATIAELKYGNLKKYDDSVYLCIGTGIGSGVILNKQLLIPKKNAGFELGHMVIVKDGIECSCGKNGCFERYGSMKILKEKIINTLNLDTNISGTDLLKIIKEKNKDKEIDNLIDEYIEYISIGIENIINIFEPEAICFGGSFVYFSDIFIPKLECKLKEKNALFNDESIPDLVCARFKNDAGIIGSVL